MEQVQDIIMEKQSTSTADKISALASGSHAGPAQSRAGAGHDVLDSDLLSRSAVLYQSQERLDSISEELGSVQAPEKAKKKLIVNSFEQNIKPLLVRQQKAREYARQKQKKEIIQGNQAMLKKLYQISFTFSHERSGYKNH